MKPTDEKILEFCRAEEVWVWNDDNAIGLVKGRPSKFLVGEDEPYKIEGWAATFKHFSLKKPVVYEDGKWYTAKHITGKKLMVRYEPSKHHVNVWEHFENGVGNLSEGGFFSTDELTNIRPIPKELWEGEG